ncbi:MAG: OmpH/Skp family outer membrane protein [Planctomycetota bacterium]|jgi:Skp family chaperone for outer membrane proteins
MRKSTLIAVFAAVMIVGAGRPGMGTAVVAHVDLERVFNECILLDKAEEELQQQAGEYQKEVDRLRAEVDLAQQDLEILIPGSEQHKKAEKALIQLVVEYQAYAEFSRASLEQLRAASRMTIFERIREAAEAYAIANNIGYIITNDANSKIQIGPDVQVIQQLLLRRVVYADPEFDVTDDLIDWINNR